jgi:hypothetical protein
MGDQTEELKARFRAEIEWVRGQLQEGTRPSRIASSLHAKGLGAIKWWSPAGITDADQFDAWAAHVLGR